MPAPDPSDEPRSKRQRKQTEKGEIYGMLASLTLSMAVENCSTAATRKTGEPRETQAASAPKAGTTTSKGNNKGKSKGVFASSLTCYVAFLITITADTTKAKAKAPPAQPARREEVRTTRLCCR